MRGAPQVGFSATIRKIKARISLLTHFRPPADLIFDPEIASKYTFKMMAGYLDSQADLWANQSTPDGPVEINSEFGFWSWVDRLNTSCPLTLCPYYPSYNKIGPRVESFMASIATAGQNGWGCPNPNELPYCSDDALRYDEHGSYATFDSFMDYARQLKPMFLILHQFNEFNSSDEGWDANTNDDIEPADQWGSRALEIGMRQGRREALQQQKRGHGQPGGNHRISPLSWPRFARRCQSTSTTS